MVAAHALAALALLPAAAHGTADSRTLVGQSDQGLPVRAVVHDGKIDRIKLRWAASCAPSGWIWGPQGTIWFNRQPAPFAVSGRHYSDHGKVSRPFQTGTVVMDQKLSGRLGARAISGVQRSTVRLYNAAGEHVDSCTSTVRFRARPKLAPRLTGLESHP